MADLAGDTSSIRSGIRSVAAAAGVSVSTVSRALNGYPEVNDATRERIIAAAKRYNYHPNTRAIRLATGRAMPRLSQMLQISATRQAR